MTYDLNRGGDRTTEPADDDVIVGIPASGAPYTTSWSRVKGWIRRALSSTAPGNTPGSPSAGSSSKAAREDHDHGITPGTSDSGTAVSAHTPASGDDELAGIDIAGTDYEIVDRESRDRLHDVEQRVHPIREVPRTWADITDTRAGWVVDDSLAPTYAGLSFAQSAVSGTSAQFVYVRVPVGARQSNYRFQYTVSGGAQNGETHNRVLGTWSGEQVASDSSWLYYRISFYEGDGFSAGKVQAGGSDVFEWEGSLTKDSVETQLDALGIPQQIDALKNVTRDLHLDGATKLVKNTAAATAGVARVAIANSALQAIEAGTQSLNVQGVTFTATLANAHFGTTATTTDKAIIRLAQTEDRSDWRILFDSTAFLAGGWVPISVSNGTAGYDYYISGQVDRTTEIALYKSTEETTFHGELVDDSVTTDKLANSIVATLGRVPSANPGNNLVWKTDGSGDPDWRADATGGSGGGASAFSELTGQIAASQIPDDVIATAKVADDAIIRAKIGSAAVGTTEIGTSAVTTAKIADSSVTGAKIAVNTITDLNLAAGVLDPKVPQWVTRTAYDKGDLVWVDVSGRTEVFACIQTVTSGTTSPPQALATHWLELDQYNGEWIAGAAWPKGHIVDHLTGSTRHWYIAQEAVTSSDPAPDDSSNTKWLRFGGGRLELSDATPVNTSTASAGTSDEVSRSDHDHGITGGSGGSAVVANPQTIAPVESEITLGTVNSVVPDGETELVPLSSLGSGTLASALSTSADTFTLKGGSYLITLHLDNIQNTTSSSNDLQYRSTLAFDVTKSGGLPAGSLCEPLPLYFRGGNASNRGEQVLRLALYLPSDTTDLQFRLIEWSSNNPTRDYGYNATPREIVIFPMGGIKGDKGDKGDSGGGGGASAFSELTGQIAASQIPDDIVTRAKIGDAAVGTDQLGVNAVTTAKIADDAITAAKIADGVIPSGGGSEVYGSNTIRKDDQDHLHLRSPNLHLGMWGRPAEDSVAPANTDDTSLAVPVRLTEVRSNDTRSTAKLSDVLYTASGPQGNPEVEGTIKVLHSSATAIEEFGSGTGYDATKPGWVWDQTNGRFHHNGVAASTANSGSTTNKFKLRVEVDYKHHAAIGTSHMSLKLDVGVPTKFGSDLTHSWLDVDLSFFDGQTRTLSYTGDIQASSAPAITDYLTVTLESIQSTSQVLFVEAVRIHFILPDSANVNYLQEYDLNNAVTWVGRNVLGPALGSHTNNQSVAGVKIVGGRMVATEDLAVLQLISNARTGVAGNGHNIRLMTRIPGLQAPTVLHEWDDSTNVWRVVQTIKAVVEGQEVWVEADSGATYSSVGSPNFVWDSSRHDSDVVDTLLYPGLIRVLTQTQYDGLSWVNPYQIYAIENAS